MIDTLIKDLREQMAQSLDQLKVELRTIHIGRADPAIIENMQVEQYGQRLPLKGVAAISVQMPSTLVVSPWDKSILPAIEAAIRESGRNLSPVADGGVIRINLPPPSEERRKELAKLVDRQAEQVRIKLRNLREEAWRKLQDEARGGQIREDERDRGRKQLDELIGEMNDEVKELVESKEREILTV